MDSFFVSSFGSTLFWGVIDHDAVCTFYFSIVLFNECTTVHLSILMMIRIVFSFFCCNSMTISIFHVFWWTYAAIFVGFIIKCDLILVGTASFQKQMHQIAINSMWFPVNINPFQHLVLTTFFNHSDLYISYCVHVVHLCKE